MSRPGRTAAAALAAGLLLVATIATPAAAQGGTDPAPAPLRIHHSVPMAGAELTLVVEGAAPGAAVTVVFGQAVDAPPSLLRRLWAEPERILDEEGGALPTLWIADDRGLVVIDAPLLAAEDAGRVVLAQAFTAAAASAPLALTVQPPLLLLPAGAGIERIDLRDGRRLLPPIAGGPDLLGAALSRDGSTGYVLHGGGRLAVHDTRRWSDATGEHVLPASTDVLAGSRLTGPAFALTRPAGEPFTPPGRAVFVDAATGAVDGELLLGPMGRPVGDRRWALSPDGLAAFVAEDMLLVREIDLLSRRSTAVYPVGRVDDGAIEDMLVADRRLHVVTSRSGERRGGTLTVLDLDTGALTMAGLDETPARLLALPDGRVLLLPRDGAVAAFVVDGVVLGDVRAPRSPDGAPGAWVDAAVTARGVLLLRRDGQGLHHLDRLGDDDRPRPFAAAVPAATRLVGAGFDAAVLVGAEDGRVRRVDATTGAVEELAGIDTRADAAFVVLD